MKESEVNMKHKLNLYQKLKEIFLREKSVAIITTHELGKYILKNKSVPTPIYSASQVREFIVKPRTIWQKQKMKNNTIKF